MAMGKPLRLIATVFLAISMALPANYAAAQEVPLSGLGRFDGWRENALIGYGLVTGLAGSGDSRRNEVTRQALRNVLSRLGSVVTEDQINSRNVAVVIVTAKLPASANPGDRIDAVVSSIGDARSLAGGTLLMTPLIGPDQRPYALAQGSLTVGGYAFEERANLEQRNYPTNAVLPGGATIEFPVDATVLVDGEVSFLLAQPSFSTAQRISDAVNRQLGFGLAYVRNADEVAIRFDRPAVELSRFLAQLESLKVVPDSPARIVVNERTGTIVAGSGVQISSVTVSQGDLKVSISTENFASQPSFIAGFANDVSSLVVSNTDIEVIQGEDDTAFSFEGGTVGTLVQALSRAGVDTRRIVSILQAMKAAGALHAEILVQ